MTRYRRGGEDRRVRLPWQAREYARTCGKCGYTWRVPRSARKWRVRTISMFLVASPRSVDRGELAREVRSISAEKEAVDVLRYCPACGADQFTQHAVHGDPTA